MSEVFKELLSDESDRRNIVKRISNFYLRYGSYYGEVYATSSKLDGVALMLPSEHLRGAFWGWIRSGLADLILHVRFAALRRLMAYERELQRVQLRHAERRHWYLAFITVAPSSERRGFGRALLEAMLERVDADRLPCYLETHLEGVLPILETYHFQVLSDFRIPDSNLRYWAMGRAALLDSAATL